jgi:hypothetical protein
MQRTESRTVSDQANKVDGPVCRRSFSQLPAIFPLVIDWAIIHVNFHSLCDHVSGAVIPLLVNACQYLINEVLLIIFLSVWLIGKLQQSGDSEKIVTVTFFEAIVGDTLGTTSSRARTNVVGNS